MLRFLAVGVLAVVLSAVVRAQEPVATQVPLELIPRQAWLVPERSFPVCWFDAAYLAWWTSHGHLPQPVLNTGNPTDAVPGAFGQPGTVSPYGTDSLNYRTYSGFRGNVGCWLDEGTWGVEAGGFFVGPEATKFRTESNGIGSPPLYVPLYRADLGRPGSFTIADPQIGLAGAFFRKSTSQLWGAEGNVLYNLLRNNGFACDAMLGFRYFGLSESLTIATSSEQPFVGYQVSTSDSFITRNSFYGAQLGVRGGWVWNVLKLDFFTKVALGGVDQQVKIGGNTTFQPSWTANPATFAGGIYTQPSNIGDYSGGGFAVIPQLGGKLGITITPSLYGFVGYDFLYWSNVVRPGGQLDTAVNPTQVGGGTLVGPVRPAPRLTTAGFIAHGVSFGLEYRY